MFETTRFESEQLVVASAVIGVSLGAFGGMMTLIAPGILGEVDIAALLETFPAAFVEEMGLRHMASIEGFIAIELYEYVWLLGLGAYLAYVAAGTIAGDIETGRLDTLLAAPISRRRLFVETYLALLTPILIVNVVVFAGVAGAGSIVEASIPLSDLAVVHLLSIPYLLVCGAFGMFASVAAPRRRIAEGVAAGAIIGTFLFEMLVTNTDLALLGGFTPMRYYDPLTILTDGSYDPAGAVVLLVASALLFEEVDVQ
jgi:ABC-2 type transport system permease protein